MTKKKRFYQKIGSLEYICKIQIISLTATPIIFFFIALKKLSSFRVELTGILFGGPKLFHIFRN